MTEVAETYSSPTSLTREGVRAALVHFAELAVAFEGGGIEIVEPGTALAERAQDDDALSCLASVVDRLNSHQSRQRENQRRELAVELHNELTDIYGRARRLDPSELDAEIATVLVRHGFQACQGDINDLAPEREALRGGPKDAAARALGPLVGRTVRSLFNYRSARNALQIWRTAWRRWVPLRLARRYVEEVLSTALAARDAAAEPALSDVAGMTESFFAMLERRAEATFRNNIRDNLELAFLGDIEAHIGSAPGELNRLLDLRKKMAELVREIARRPDGSVDDERADQEYRRHALEMIEREVAEMGLDGPALMKGDRE